MRTDIRYIEFSLLCVDYLAYHNHHHHHRRTTSAPHAFFCRVCDTPRTSCWINRVTCSLPLHAMLCSSCKLRSCPLCRLPADSTTSSRSCASLSSPSPPPPPPMPTQSSVRGKRRGKNLVHCNPCTLSPTLCWIFAAVGLYMEALLIGG